MIKDNLIKDFLEFAEEANTRSTVHIQDGLKPVHRRVLYDMATLSKATKDYVGSAKIVGDTLGAFHPHGDSSVYDAAVRLAQPFKTRYPLISFSGNLGSVAQPSGWAHQRYTKMKLSPFGLELLNTIDKKTVDMTETYNGESLEPVTLPGLLPIALLNGTLGIGVGMSSSLPPHNLKEVLTAANLLLDKPEATVQDLMRYIKGPDFPTGGQIINPEQLLNAYETGRGSVKLRAKYDVVANKGKTSIIIQEVPYLVDPEERILAPLIAMHEEGYEYIEDIINHTGKNHPFKLEIVLKKEAPVFAVLERLHKETGIETSFTINNTVYLGNSKFKCLNLKEMLERYISTSLKTLVKAAQFDLNKAENRLEIVQGLIKAIANIDEIVKIIRASKNGGEASQNLIKKWNFSEIQAKAILDMKLSRLTNLDESKLLSEQGELNTLIENLENFISSKDLQKSKLSDMFKTYITKFGDGRRTRIEGAADIAEGEEEEIYLFITEDNKIFGMKELDFTRRNTKGKKFPAISSVLKCASSDTIYVLTESGTLNPVAAYSLMTGGEDSMVDGLEIFNSQPIQLLKWEEKEYLISYSKYGKIKVSSVKEYKKDKVNVVAKFSEKDCAAKVWFANSDDHLLAITQQNKYIYAPVSELKVSGRMTVGVKFGAKQPKTIDLVSNNAIFWSEDSKGKIVKSKDLVESGIKSSGLACNNSVGAVSAANLCVVQSSEGRTIFIKNDSISSMGIAAQGVSIMNGSIQKILTS